MALNINVPVIIQALPTVIAAYLSGSITFRVGAYVVSASKVGDSTQTPVKMTFAQALLAVENVLTGKIGSVTTGSTIITIAPYVA
jgi:hypothetical protein